MIRVCGAVLLVLLLASCASGFELREQGPPLPGASRASEREEGVPVGVTYGVFRPRNSSTKDNFGKSWNRIGISRVDTSVPSDWKPTFGFLSLSADGPGSASLFGVNWGLVRGLPAGSPDVRPYAGIHAGPVYANVRSAALGVDTTTVALNGGLSLGLVLGRTVFVEARYDAFTRVGGVDFSGFSWEAGVRLFNVRF